jgi:hypothetical protein
LSATTARTEEVIQALAGAEEEVLALRQTGEKLRGELETAHARLEEAAGIRSQLAAVEGELRTERERAGSAETQCASLQSACDGFKKEIEVLRSGSRRYDGRTGTAGAARTLRRLGERTWPRFGSAGRPRGEHQEAERHRRAIERGFEKNPSLYADAERRAEEASEGKLLKDNDVLRGIIERQNLVLSENGRELRILRRGQFALRMSLRRFQHDPAGAGDLRAEHSEAAPSGALRKLYREKQFSTHIHPSDVHSFRGFSFGAPISPAPVQHI